MNSKFWSPSPLLGFSLFITTLAFIKILVSLCSSYDGYSSCSNLFNCGEITNVGFPFWGDTRPDACGIPQLKLSCEINITTVQIMKVKYRVLDIDSKTKILKIIREDYSNGIRSPYSVNTTFDSKLFVGNLLVMVKAIKGGFEVRWKEDSEGCSGCIRSKGVCGYDLTSNHTTCYRPNQSFGPKTCPSPPTVPIRSQVRALEEIQKQENATMVVYSAPTPQQPQGTPTVVYSAPTPQQPQGTPMVVFSGPTEQPPQGTPTVVFSGPTEQPPQGSPTVVFPTPTPQPPPPTGSPQVPPVARSPHVPPTAGSPQVPPVAGSPHVPPVAGSPHVPPVAGSPHVPPVAGSPQVLLATPGSSSKNNRRFKIAIGISASVVGITVICCVIYCCLKREQLSSKVIVCLKIDDLNAEESMKNYGSLAPKRYIYSDVKKLTNSFTDKVGQGGYGAVYKGKLPDGRLVAVKVLSESKGNGEEFMNEVASISKTSHVNIVSLLGFSHEKTKRALIYEFMPNGSLDKFIYNTNSRLDWKTMYQIALGVARGLEYLHRGCSTRILHFDIKPHNILLDEDLCPKISDFGLAKLCKIKESIVSMTGMRGTAGYIAPEVFSRNFGGISHKSDVYSYGMLVLEMVGGRKNFDAGAFHTSEIYFPHWIYKKLELGENVSTYERIIEEEEEEEETARKMITVSLWCIQTNPSDRPSMGKVIEMLEGTLESLQFPPKPFFDSPSRSPQHSSG